MIAYEQRRLCSNCAIAVAVNEFLKLRFDQTAWMPLSYIEDFAQVSIHDTVRYIYLCRGSSFAIDLKTVDSMTRSLCQSHLKAK